MSDKNNPDNATPDETQQHWLVRPKTIRQLWIVFSVVLAATVFAQLFVYIKGYFVVDGWFGFGAVFGLLSCVAMVVVAKFLGVVLKRPEDYYDD
jgi:uncharacterized membrane protein